MKSKMGITVSLVGACIYFSSLIGGILVILLLAAYVLLVEDNEWLRITAVKATVLYVGFELLVLLVGLIPDAISFISSFFEIFNGKVSIPFISSIAAFLKEGIHLFRTVLFIILGVKAFNQGTIVIPFVDRFVNKYIQ